MPHAENLLDDLTPEEREAIESYDAEQAQASADTDKNDNDDQGADDVNASEQQDANDQDTTVDDGGAGDADAGADAADGAVDAQPADAADDTQAQADAPAAKADDVPAQPAAASAPLLIVEAPEDADGKLAKIADDKKAILQKYEDGELTGAEMQAQTDALNEQALEIKLAVREAALAQKMEQQRLNALWVNDCNTFLAKHPEYADKERSNLLDEYILALSKVPSNGSLTNAQALEKAHKMVKVHLNEPLDDPKPQPEQKKVANKQPIPKPDPQPNIASLPAATIADTSGGEFASLDRLQKSDPIAYEEKLYAMTPAQRERYLRA